MKVVKSLSVVLLAVFLIVTGFVGFSGVVLPQVVNVLVNLSAFVSGVLFLFLVVKFGGCCHECHDGDVCKK